MHFLVAIGNNLDEWQDTLRHREDKPRLPLPYAFGAALVNGGHKLSAINLAGGVDERVSCAPFERIYRSNEMSIAMRAVDVVSLWGSFGISAVLRQAVLPKRRRQVLLNSYVWQPARGQSFLAARLRIATHIAARFGRGVVLMTEEQVQYARAKLPMEVPVVALRCGIDTAYYAKVPSLSDVPDEHRRSVERLLKAPYVIMPGDELRLNEDALAVVEHTNLHLVRISQYSSKSRTDILKQQVATRGLSDRVTVFEKISYPFLRFLLHNAACYAGLVDSSWQPAGWTVACEALASGLPIVLYEGLVSRELHGLGISKSLVRTAPMRDLPAFQRILVDTVSSHPDPKLSAEARCVAARFLNLEITGPHFVRKLEEALLLSA